jgi:hypothetical protein
MFTYLVHDLLTRELITTLDLTGVSFSDPLTGAGQLGATLVVDPDADFNTLRRAVDLDRAAIYVVSGRQILWPGVIISAPYDHSAGTISLTAVQMSSWLADRLHGTGTTATKWTAKDQLQIARELVTYAQTGVGCPKIKVGAETSGVNRDLTIDAQSFVAVDGLIDGMAKATNGFDWSISARYAAADGLPELYLGLYYPERKSGASGTLFFSNDSKGGNIQSFTWPNDASQRKTKVWALGDGDVPKMMTASDTDPEVLAGRRLLREKTTSYTGKGITKAATLASNARAERLALSDTVGTATIDLTIDDPNVASYVVGDRARIRLQDMWLDVDLPAVRIIDRSIHDEDRSQTAQVTLTLDVSDYDLPQDAEV